MLERNLLMQSILYALRLKVKSAGTRFDAKLRLRAAETRIVSAVPDAFCPANVNSQVRQSGRNLQPGWETDLDFPGRLD